MSTTQQTPDQHPTGWLERFGSIGTSPSFNLIYLVFLFFPWLFVTPSNVDIAVALLATAIFRKSIRSGYRGVRKANAEINTSLVETITGIKEINQFNNQEQREDMVHGYSQTQASSAQPVSNPLKYNNQDQREDIVSGYSQ